MNDTGSWEPLVTSKDHCNVHQLFIVTSLHLLLPVIQTNFFLVQRFTNRRKKNPQKLNVFFLDQNCRNFTPQKLPVIRYSLYNMFFKPNFLIQCHLWKKIGTWFERRCLIGQVLSTQIMTDSSKYCCWDSILGRPRGKKETNWKWRWETGVWKKLSLQKFFLKMTKRATLVSF